MTAGGATAATQKDAAGATVATSATVYGGGKRTLTDPEGHKKDEHLDGHGRLVRVDEIGGATAGTTTYTYDLLDGLTRTENAIGAVNTVAYDGLHRKKQLNDADSGTWTYGYDGLGRLAHQTDAKNQRLDFTYDNAGRLWRKEGSSPAEAKRTLAVYLHDEGGAAAYGLGRRTKMEDASGETRWTYDSRGRVVYLDQTVLGTTYRTVHAYDGLDRPTAVTYPSAAGAAAEVVTTTYGAHGRPVGVSGAGGAAGAGQVYASGAAYTALLQPSGWTYGNGVTAAFQ